MDSKDAEVIANLERGFTQFWPVYEDYAIVDGALCWQGKQKYSYAPMVHEEIPNQLAQLKRGDEADVLQFARTYGSLGYQKFLPPTGGVWKPIGDPLSWIWTHSETIRFCLEISKLLHEEDLDTLKDVICSQHVTLKDVEEFYKPHEVEEIEYVLYLLQQPSWGIRGKFPTMMVAERDKVRLAWHGLPNGKCLSDIDDMAYHARLFRNSVINANIQGIDRALPMGARSSIKDRSYWKFSALIQTAYWHLADTLDRGRIKRCEECQAPFIQRDKRQRFCPPPASPIPSKRRHSRCGTRKRVQEYRRPK
jgi:hypothetical protein